MTIGEMVLLVGLLAHAILFAFAFFFAMRANNKNTAAVIKDVHEIKVATDGMHTALLEATKEAALLTGANQERAEVKAEKEIADKLPSVGIAIVPVPVVDDQAAGYQERIAKATEKSADADKRIADAAEEKRRP